jgi:hypothetical protein
MRTHQSKALHFENFRHTLPIVKFQIKVAPNKISLFTWILTRIKFRCNRNHFRDIFHARSHWGLIFSPAAPKKIAYHLLLSMLPACYRTLLCQSKQAATGSQEFIAFKLFMCGVLVVCISVRRRNSKEVLKSNACIQVDDDVSKRIHINAFVWLVDSISKEMLLRCTVWCYSHIT